jgi:hypothetical protein
MASGDTLLVFTALNNEPPASGYATLDVRNNHPVLDFDGGTAHEYAVFSGVMPRHYGGGGIKVYLHCLASGSAGDDFVVWTGAFERVSPLQQDIDTDGFAASKSTVLALDDNTGYVSVGEISFSDGSEIDNVAAGEGFRLKIGRDPDNESDTLEADAELLWIELKEA